MMIKAIDTWYKGDFFRSRLEARWAVFFRTLGIEYKYEPDGYDINGTWYLPDFYLPDQGYWLEIKPNIDGLDKPDHILFDYMEKKTDWNREPVVFHPLNFFVIVGDPWIDPLEHPSTGIKYQAHLLFDSFYYWCECPRCNRIELQYEGRADRTACKTCYTCAILESGQRAYDEDFNELKACPVHGENYDTSGCKYSSHNLDRGHNIYTDNLMRAYRAARSARFEHGESG
ncbi:MAG: PDDEXK family nuclease [Planctomycetota bacterium]|jgi:hypothetical protein